MTYRFEENQFKSDCKNLIQKFHRIERFRFFSIFREDEVNNPEFGEKDFKHRINAALLRKSMDQQGAGIGCFRDMDDTNFILVLEKIHKFLNLIIKFFLINKNISAISSIEDILEEREKYEDILKEIKDKYLEEKLDHKILNLFKGFGRLNSRIRKDSELEKKFYRGKIPKYGEEIWDNLIEISDSLKKSQKQEILKSIKGKSFKNLTENCEKYRRIKINTMDDVILNTIKILEESLNSIGGSKAFVLLKALCKNAKFLSENPLKIFETIRDTVGSIKLSDNPVECATKIHHEIQSFVKKAGIKQVGGAIASYFLRDLVTEVKPLNINIEEDNLNTSFARYCLKPDINSQLFIKVTGLILLPSFFKDKIEKFIAIADLTENVKNNLFSYLNNIINYKEEFRTEYGGIDWHSFIEQHKTNLKSDCETYEVHILVNSAIDQLFSSDIKEESIYKQNFGLLNEICYMKCQAHCNNASKYLCWNTFKPVKDETPLITSFCNIANFCLLNISKKTF